MRISKVLITCMLLLATDRSLATERLFTQGTTASLRQNQYLSLPLQAILENAASEQVTMLHIQPEAVSASNDQIAFELEKGKTVVARKFQFDKKANGVQIWRGYFAENARTHTVRHGVVA